LRVTSARLSQVKATGRLDGTWTKKGNQYLTTKTPPLTRGITKTQPPQDSMRTPPPTRNPYFTSPLLS
jgi:hypothetical protein